MTTSAPRALVLGFGGVGVLYAYILHRGGAHVTAVCRSNYDMVRQNGIDIISGKFGNHKQYRPDHVVHSPDQVKGLQFDYIVCTYKCVSDMQPSSDVIYPYLEKMDRVKLPYIVLIQNGVDIEKGVYDTLVNTNNPLARAIISGVTWVATTLLGGGSRIEHGTLERLCLGLYPAPLQAQVPNAIADAITLLTSTMRQGGSSVEDTNDIASFRWNKTLWNTSWGALSTLARAPLRDILTAEALPYTSGVVRGLMLEVLAVARAVGLNEHRLPAKLLDDTYRLALIGTPAKVRLSRNPDTFFDTKEDAFLPGYFKPSILVDLEHGRPMELDPIFGNIVKLGRKHNVDTPRLDMVLASLKPTQLRFICNARGEQAETQQSNIYDALPSLNVTGNAPILS
ncbi:2-dehydropantoate 2-reductase [Malassezia vespertilionis]|uniref:2-dehydropantoate 2-reductase n=1 Tax=Malassezia vespertilionis TaxID=2020962 RepID=UPI0024B24087|nr:2-dehydropantoate 2-reductase [Malassezia vespertilionis]WFD07496.1 2-dehydropantoate 2-reductase [Malassezia vespertilionis]